MSEQIPEPQAEMSNSLRFFIGLGIGLVPLILGLLAIGNARGGNVLTFLFVSALFYVALLVAAIVCLCFARLRFIGYGMLAMVFATPVIAYIACMVTLSRA